MVMGTMVLVVQVIQFKVIEISLLNTLLIMDGSHLLLVLFHVGCLVLDSSIQVVKSKARCSITLHYYYQHLSQCLINGRFCIEVETDNWKLLNFRELLMTLVRNRD